MAMLVPTRAIDVADIDVIGKSAAYILDHQFIT